MVQDLEKFQSVVTGLVPDVEMVQEHDQPAIMTQNSNKDGKIPSLQTLIETNLGYADVSKIFPFSVQN